MFAVLVVALVVLIVLGVPIAFSLGLSTVLFTFLWGEVPVSYIFQQMYKGVYSFPLLSIPFFMLVGELMVHSRLMDILLEFVNYLVGRVRGGLAQVNIAGSMFFAGISGSGSADTAALGSILIPAMNKSGYDRDYSVAITAASSVVGPIIPPSITMILYASIVPISIGGLFAGGMIPGILIGLSLMLLAYVFSIRKQHPISLEKFSVKGLLKSFLRAFPALLLPVIILGGILGGVFTPTEASVTAAAYAIFIGTVVYRTLTLRTIIKCFANASVTSSIILIMAAVSNPFSKILALLQIPQEITQFIGEITSNGWVALALIMIFLLIMGAVMETAANIFILAPIVTPLAMSFGIDPLHFGVLFVMNICIGLATPPFGLCLFIATSIGETPLEKASRAILPFVAAEIIVLFLCAYFPQIVLYVPKLLGFV